MSCSPTQRLLIGRIVPAAILALILAGSVSAQVSAIAFNQRMSTYTPISGTVIAGSTGYADDESYTVNLPFSFKYNGNLYTTIYPCTNGYITLGYPDPYLYPYPMFTSSWYGGPSVMGVICPWAADLHGAYSGEMSYQIDGTAPNRVCTVQWKNWHFYYQSADVLNFQVKLYEGTGLIEFSYGPCSYNSYSRYVYVGLVGPYPAYYTYPTDWQARSVPAGTGDWLYSVNGTNSTSYPYSYCSFSSSDGPREGLLYRWGCYVPEDKIAFGLTDDAGQPLSYINVPSMVFGHVFVGYPATAISVDVTFDFYMIGGSTTVPVYSYSTTLNKPAGDLDTNVPIAISGIPSGYYNVVASIRTTNSCDEYEAVKKSVAVLILQQGQQPCIVWPGDVNNDGIVNYGDRVALNNYIAHANLQPTWLNGPARYRTDAAQNPFAYLTWEAQPGVPWATTDGCYMDVDGNGAINNFDLLGIRLNWYRTHGTPKPASSEKPLSFDLAQNFPNPFNPSTTISYTVPERSQVTLVVMDMNGRTIATLVDGIVDAGAHGVTFDASTLTSGSYLATVSMTGTETGTTFSRTIKMALMK